MSIQAVRTEEESPSSTALNVSPSSDDDSI